MRISKRSVVAILAVVVMVFGSGCIKKPPRNNDGGYERGCISTRCNESTDKDTP